MTSSMPVGKCCISGHAQIGSPQGSMGRLGGVDAYIAQPPDNNKARTVVFYTDVFGLIDNPKLLADEFAKAGFYTIVPDLFGGDNIDPTLLEQSKESQGWLGFIKSNVYMLTSVVPWLYRHRETVTKPMCISVIEALRADNEIKKVAVVGFCFGGRYALRHLSATSGYPLVDCSISNHPGMLGMPNEIEEIERPALIQVGDNDERMPPIQVKAAQEIFKGRENCEIKVFPGAKHGWTVRPDPNDVKAQKQKKEATQNALDFLNKHLT